MHRIIFLGPPGAGKGTQAEKLCAANSLEHISTGVILREAVEAGSELGKKAKDFLDRGELVTDDLMIALIRERLSSMDPGQGFLLDGFPRTLAQAEGLTTLLSEIEREITAVIEISVDEKLVLERLLKRAQEQGRSDDTEEVIKRRLEVYRTQTEPVTAFYEGRAGVKRVNGEGTVEEVSKRVSEALEA